MGGHVVSIPILQITFGLHWNAAYGSKWLENGSGDGKVGVREWWAWQRLSVVNIRHSTWQFFISHFTPPFKYNSQFLEGREKGDICLMLKLAFFRASRIRRVGRSHCH